jgi:hypothetical protein
MVPCHLEENASRVGDTRHLHFPHQSSRLVAAHLNVVSMLKAIENNCANGVLTEYGS